MLPTIEWNDEGVVMIDVVYRVKSTNSRFNLVFPYYLQEGTDVNIASSLKQLSEDA